MNQLNPIQQNIANGMSAIAAFLTEATCGVACWEAREDVCHCSCNGKNHGCMRSAEGVQPVRTAKIDGYRYELAAVNAGYDEAKAINEANGPYRTERIAATKWSDELQAFAPSEMVYRYWWHETDAGAPARLKPATKSQIAKWPELSAYRDTPPYRSVYLLWVKVA